MVGNSLYSKRTSIELTWIFHGKEIQKSLEGNSFVSILDVVEGNEQKSL